MPGPLNVRDLADMPAASCPRRRRDPASVTLVASLQVLLLLAGGGRWRVLSIARHFGFSKARVERTLATLVEAGLPVERAQLGTQAFAWSLNMDGEWPLLDLLRDNAVRVASKATEPPPPLSVVRVPRPPPALTREQLLVRPLKPKSGVEECASQPGRHVDAYPLEAAS